jgi:O-antigen/teichoic acid export membrane protein
MRGPRVLLSEAAAVSRARSPYSRDRFRKALRWFVVGRAAQALASIAFLLLAIRVLPATDYGIYMVLIGLVEVLRPLSSLGLLPAVQQFLPEMALHASARQLRRFVGLATASRFAALGLFAAALYVAWAPVSQLLGFHRIVPRPPIAACLLVVTLLGASYTDHMLDALLEQRSAQLIRALMPLGRLVGLIALVLAGEPDLQTMVWIDLAVSSGCLVMAELILWKRLRELRPDGSRQFRVAEIMGFAWHLSGAQVLNALGSAGMLRMVVSAGLGATAAGQFAFIQQLLGQTQKLMPSLLLANLVRPMLIAANVQAQRARISPAVTFLRKSNFILSAMVILCVLLGGDELLSMLSGGRLPEMGGVLALLAIAAVSAAQSQITNMLLQVFRRSSLVRSLSLLALLTLCLAWLGTRHGLLAVAGGIALGNWVRSATSLWALHWHEPWLATDRAALLRVGLAFGALTTLLLAAAGQGLWQMAMAIAFTGPLLVVIKPLSADDVDLIESAVQGRTGRWLDGLLRLFRHRNVAGARG